MAVGKQVQWGDNGRLTRQALFTGKWLLRIKAGPQRPTCPVPLTPRLWGLARDMRRLQAVNKVEPIA